MHQLHIYDIGIYYNFKLQLMNDMYSFNVCLVLHFIPRLFCNASGQFKFEQFCYLFSINLVNC